MKSYKVEWTIELNAASARDAAKQAWEIMRDPASIATIFEVYDENGNLIPIDLLEEPDANEQG